MMPGWMLVSSLKIVQYTVVKFWKSELKLPNGIDKTNTKEVVKYTMRTAWQSFPYWHRIVHRKKDAIPVHDIEGLLVFAVEQTSSISCLNS
eukprot:scaffold101627_cov70-Cyclotella_meneghiniana.AAC.2